MASLDRPQKDGSVPRTHLEQHARQMRERFGLDSTQYAAALQELEGPSCPVALEYLRDWSDDLHGRSGITMDGVAPLNWTTLHAWSVLTGHSPNEAECAALLQLDAVRLHPVIAHG